MSTPVTLRIGDHTRLLGSLELGNDSADDEILEVFERKVAEALAEATRSLYQASDMRELVKKVPALRKAIQQADPDGEPSGVAVGVLRREANITLVSMARAMKRDPGTVRAWERGRKTKMHVSDLRKAAAHVGHDATAVLLLADAIAERIEGHGRPEWQTAIDARLIEYAGEKQGPQPAGPS